MAAVDLYLMSPPGPGWALRGRANFRSEDAAAVNPAQALVEWIALADAIVARGGRVVCLLPPDDSSLTGLPYAAECGQIVAPRVSGERASFLLPNMKPAHRQGERALWKDAAEAMGLATVDVDGTWEAQGDVAYFRETPILFFGGRTTERGARDAARRLAKTARDVLFVEIHEPAFHGNMALLPLPHADRALVCPDVLGGGSLVRLESVFGAGSLLHVSVEEVRSYATNGLPVGADVLAPDVTPARVQELLRSLGLSVVPLTMRELCEKGGGAARCLVSHARLEESSFRLPARLDYLALRDDLVQRCATGRA